MSKEEIRTTASQTLPAGVQIPASWGGLIVWAVGKWGTGAVFLCLLVPVYMDLKASNERFAEIAQASARATDALATKIEISNSAILRLDDAIRRIESHNSKP